MKPAARWTALQWRVDEPPFNNKALRQAIALAIDRNELRDVLLRGFGEAALAQGRTIPAASQNHSRTTPTRNQPVLLQLSRRPEDLESAISPKAAPVSACAESPLAGFDPTGSAT